LYKKGCELIFKWIKYDNIPVRKEELKRKLGDYIEHAEKLK